MPRSITTHVRPGLGARLRQARLAAGLSQRQLSFDGCTSAYISRIEADGRTPPLQMLNELANRLQCDRTWLATGEVARDDDLRAQLRAVTAERDALRQRLAQIAAIATL